MSSKKMSASTKNKSNVQSPNMADSMPNDIPSPMAPAFRAHFPTMNGMTNNFDVNVTKNNFDVAKVVTWKGDWDDSRNVHAANFDLGVFASRQRARGESKRKHSAQGDTSHSFNCACGKSSGDKFSIKSFYTWKRLHKKVCPLLK